jgi:hypothetical protein
MNKQNNNSKSIKEYERAQRAKAQEPAAISVVVDFDQWWSDRAAALKQPAHIKEILKVDAKARGVSGKQPLEKWDWAAKQFGLSI